MESNHFYNLTPVQVLVWCLHEGYRPMGVRKIEISSHLPGEERTYLRLDVYHEVIPAPTPNDFCKVNVIAFMVPERGQYGEVKALMEAHDRG